MPPDQPAHPADARPEGAAERPRRRRPTTWLLVAALVVALAGTAAAVGAKLVGGGPQPDTLVPSTALMYLRVDVDPSVGQKVSAIRFLQKVPQARRALEGGDPRKGLVTSALRSRPSLPSVDYDKDIAPWLGDRLGVALLPPTGTGDPVPMVVAQVEDEDKARAGIARLTRTMAPKPDVVFKDGYALVTGAGRSRDILAAVSRRTLADNPTYAADVTALGEQGVASGWVDLAAAAKYADAFAGDGMLTAAAQPSAATLAGAGRTAFALRFDADSVELVGISRGATALKKKTSGAAASAVTRLPADTAVALSIPGADAMVGTAWSGIKEGLAAQAPGQDVDGELQALQSQIGFSLPGDLQTLLGRNLVLALPAQAFGGSDPQFGLRVTTDAAKAESIVTRLEQLAIQTGGELSVKHRAVGDQFYLASSDSYLAKLTADGSLGDTPGFRAAVPDADKAQFVVYADLDRLEKDYLDQVPARERGLVKALRSVGASGSSTGNGEGRFTVRLVGN